MSKCQQKANLVYYLKYR